MDAPLCGKFEMVIDWGHHLDDLKRSMISGCKLGCRLTETEISSF